MISSLYCAPCQRRTHKVYEMTKGVARACSSARRQHRGLACAPSPAHKSAKVLISAAAFSPITPTVEKVQHSLLFFRSTATRRPVSTGTQATPASNKWPVITSAKLADKGDFSVVCTFALPVLQANHHSSSSIRPAQKLQYQTSIGLHLAIVEAVRRFQAKCQFINFLP